MTIDRARRARRLALPLLAAILLIPGFSRATGDIGISTVTQGTYRFDAAATSTPSAGALPAADTPAPSATPRPTDTPQPTATPTPSPTPVPTPTGTPKPAIPVDGSEAVLPETAGNFAWRLRDGDWNSRVSIATGETLSIRLADTADALLLVWYETPTQVRIVQRDAAGAQIGEAAATGGGALETVVRPDSACRRVELVAEEPFSLAEYRLLTAAEADAWFLPAQPDKVDLMVIAAHTGDETEYFSGLIPAYAGGKGMATVTVFLSHKDRLAQREATIVQQASGEANAPIFLGQWYRFLDEDYEKTAERFWKTHEILPQLVAAIRRYEPEVVVTNAAYGETHDMMHGWTAKLVRLAAESAADERRYPESAAAYGAWQVKKVYLHDNGESPKAGVAAPPTPGPVTTVEVSEPLLRFDGKTALAVAQENIGLYETLALYRLTASQTAPGYTLAASTVGPDAACNDLFEHIDASLLTGGRAEVTPVPTATFAVTATPTPEASADPETTPVAQTEQTGGAAIWVWLFPACGAGLSGLLFAVLRKRQSRLLWLCALPLLLGAGLALLTNARPLSPAIPTGGAKTAVSSAQADGAEAEIPTPTLPATPLPTATPNPDDALFRQPDEAAEVVVSDGENGHWEYRSDTLSILIDRHKQDEGGKRPVVWYTAHIRMRGVNAYRSGLGDYSERGSAKLRPWRIARKYGAVLAITGDNLINSEEGSKGVLIRNGKLYSDRSREATMGLTDDMSMRLYPAGTEAAQIMEDGIRDSYGFGPILVQDGKFYPGALSHRAKSNNPRCGLGLVEPGHFVAIVVDGRQPYYSVGLGIEDYAQLFIDEGCVSAFNMDGGISAGLVFMGEHLNQHKSSSGGVVSRQRSWPDALMWGYSSLVPSLSDPIINTGNADEAARNRNKYATPSPLPTVTPKP